MSFWKRNLTIEKDTSSLQLGDVQNTNSIPGEIKYWAALTIPSGWLLCDGSEVSRSTYATLFSVIGTTYGVGDGMSTFNLPDASGRTLIGDGNGTGTSRTIGDKGGEETHTMTVQELTTHNHFVNLGGPATTSSGTNNFLGNITGVNIIFDGEAGGNMMASDSVMNSGGGNPYNIMQPYLALQIIIKT